MSDDQHDPPEQEPPPQPDFNPRPKPMPLLRTPVEDLPEDHLALHFSPEQVRSSLRQHLFAKTTRVHNVWP